MDGGMGLRQAVRAVARVAGLAALVWLAEPGAARAQDAAAEPAKPLTGTLSAGISLTSGNTDTLNYSIGLDAAYAPPGPNGLTFTSLLLRGKQNGVRSVDRTSLAIRDQYAVSERAFVFGKVEFLRDRFKRIESLVAPSAGAGVKVVAMKALQMAVDTGVAVVSEKDTDLTTRTGGALTAGEQVTWAVTSTATVHQATTNLWKTADLGDHLHTLSLGLTTKVSERIQVSIDALDTYKSQVPGPATKKNDVAVVAALSAKF